MVQGLHIELADSSRQNSLQRVPVMLNGTFELRNVESGTYELRLITDHGDILRRDMLHVHEYGNSITVRMPESKGSAPTGQVVSAGELRHKPEERAHNAFKDAAKKL